MNKLYTENDSKVGNLARRLRKFFVWSERPLCKHKAQVKTKNWLHSQRSQKPTFGSFSVYLLPISLLLLSPSFAEAFENSAVPSEEVVMPLEEAQELIATESEFPLLEDPFIESETAVGEIDPEALEELKTEIASMLEKISKPQEATADAQKESTKTEQSVAQELVEEEQEVAENENSSQEKQLKPTSKRERNAVAEEEQALAEKEPGSQVRRYVTKPSAAESNQAQATDEQNAPHVKSTTPPANSTPVPRKRQPITPSAKLPNKKAQAAEAPTAEQQKPRSNPSTQRRPSSQYPKKPSTARTPKSKSSTAQKKSAATPPASQSPESNKAAKPERPAAQAKTRKQQPLSQLQPEYQIQPEEPNYAQTPQGQDSSDWMNSQSSTQSQTSMQQNKPAKAKNKMYNTAARPVTQNGYDVWVMGDTLLWQAVEENLTYIYSGNDTATESNRNFHTVDFNWDWGFRLGAGYNACRDGWDIDLYWTHIRNTGNGHRNASATESLFAVWETAANPITGTINFAKGQWRVHLDQVDLDLGREFYVGKYLTLRPFVGVRSDWIFQEYDIEMKGTLTNTSAFEQINKLKNRFWGFGFAAGLDTNWILGWGFSVYGEADISVILGFFDIKQKGFRNSTKIQSEDKSFRTGRAIFDLGMGLKWAWLFCKERFGLTLKAGYEYHLYFNQNQFVLSNGNSALELFNPVKGDLAYQGGIGTIQFDF